MPTISHRGRTTAYETSEGSGEPVLFVHGSGADRTVWRGQHRLDRPVVALDLSGHGESDDVDADAGYETLAAYADDVVAVVHETGARVVGGHSLGGAVVLSLALDRELTVDGLVLAGTGARLAVLEDLRVWLDDDFDRAVEFLHRPDRLFHDADERTLERSRETLRAVGRETTRRDFLTAHAFDVRDRLDAVTAPALAVVGEHDQLTPPWYHEYLADECADCGLAVLEDAAHAAMLERPAAFNAAVERFLRRA